MVDTDRKCKQDAWRVLLDIISLRLNDHDPTPLDPNTMSSHHTRICTR